MIKRKKKELQQHRPNAAVVLFNRQGRVWMGRRANSQGRHVWQFPQGGIDEGEKPLAAAIREMAEETGVSPDLVKKIGKIKGWLAYDFPEDVGQAPNKRLLWNGQKQKWFAFKFLGKDTDFHLDAHQPPEFDAWKWVKLEDAPQKIIPWKRHVYDEVVQKFLRFSSRKK